MPQLFPRKYRGAPVLQEKRFPLNGRALPFVVSSSDAPHRADRRHAARDRRHNCRRAAADANDRLRPRQHRRRRRRSGSAGRALRAAAGRPRPDDSRLDRAAGAFSRSARPDRVGRRARAARHRVRARHLDRACLRELHEPQRRYGRCAIPPVLGKPARGCGRGHDRVITLRSRLRHWPPRAECGHPRPAPP